jgi:hypothetical protein
MSKRLTRYPGNIVRYLAFVVALISGLSVATSAFAQGKKTSSGEQFLIVASVDRQKSQLLLKYPTEVTALVKISPDAQFLDATGKPIKLSDLRTGDTVWATLTGDPANPTATKIRLGQMTVADLHRYYLDYPEIE